MKRFYLSKSIYACGNSAIALFVPVFFFQQHLPLATIFAFYAITSAVHAMLVRAAMGGAVRFGVVRIFVAGIALTALLNLALRSVPITPESIMWLAVLSGVANAIYWTGYHLYLSARYSSQSGSQLGYVKNISKIASIAGPAVGAVVAAHFGFQVLFAFAAAIMLVSSLPLIGESRTPSGSCPTLREAFGPRSAGEIGALVLGFGPEDAAQGTVWPLYMVAAGGLGVMWLGFTYTAVFCAMLVITHVIAVATNRNASLVLIAGAIGNAAINAARAIGVTSPMTVSWLTLGAEALTTATNVPMDALCYQRANDHGMSYLLFREVAINAGGAIFFALGVVTQSFAVLFAVAAIASLMYMGFAISPNRTREIA